MGFELYPIASLAMNDQALIRYLATCCRRLNQQQTALINDFALRTCADLEVQPGAGLLNVDLPGRGRAIANIIPIARYRPSGRTWSWAWAASEPYPLHHHGAAALQSLATKTGLELFAAPQLELSLEPTSLLLAMACSRLKASGYYRWRLGDEFIFLAINHMALATAPLEYSNQGDRLQLAQLQQRSDRSRAQVSQLVRPSPSLLGQFTPAPSWPHQRSVEGLFAHMLCQVCLTDGEQALAELKAL